MNMMASSTTSFSSCSSRASRKEESSSASPGPSTNLGAKAAGKGGIGQAVEAHKRVVFSGP